MIDTLFPSNGVPVLLYHSIDTSRSANSVSPEHFAEQISWLRDQGWMTIGLDDLVAHLRRRQLPKRRFVITFDDGFQNVFTEALPRVNAMGFTATVCLTTGHVGGWNSYVKREMPRLPMLTWKQLQVMKECGWQIESHGHTHTDLPLLDWAECCSELRLSRECIYNNLGVYPKHFCYPRGKYSDEIIRAVQDTGYESALSLRVGFVTPQSNPWALERVWVSDAGLWHFRAQLSTLYAWASARRRKQVRA